MQHLRDNHRLLTVAAGDSTVRVLPPLVIGDAEIDGVSSTSSPPARPISSRRSRRDGERGTFSTCRTPAATRSRR
jgi:hypothetical protein